MKDDLDQLLEAERRIAARLDEATAAATRLLEVARADALAVARRVEGDTRAGRARAEAETAAAVEVELQRIAAQAQERVGMYTDVSADRLKELALFVLRTLLENEAEERP